VALRSPALPLLAIGRRALRRRTVPLGPVAHRAEVPAAPWPLTRRPLLAGAGGVAVVGDLVAGHCSLAARAVAPTRPWLR
jgi:hypothetical protein